MSNTSLPMLSLIEETVLPCEERAIEVSRLAPAAVAWLAAQPAGALLLLVPVTAHAEVPLLVGGRHASLVRLLVAPSTTPSTTPPTATFAGVDRVRILRAYGPAVPHLADVQPGSVTAQAALGPLVVDATVALSTAPAPLANLDPWRALAATLVRELGGPGAARRALAEGDLATLLAELTTTHLAESAGREALATIEDKVRLLAAEPKLSKGLRQRLHSAVVEVSRRLDLYDTHTANDDDLDELDTLRRKIDQGHLPLAARQVAERELRLLRSTRTDNHDYPTHLRLLQLITRLAWHADPLPPIDLARVNAVLERDHAGLERPKRRILEYLAVRALGGDARSTVLCLAGPPGVGKTSIARAMAEALGRPFLRIALGGVNDQSELRGHRITYTASRPGRIIEGLAQVRCVGKAKVVWLARTGADGRPRTARCGFRAVQRVARARSAVFGFGRLQGDELSLLPGYSTAFVRGVDVRGTVRPRRSRAEVPPREVRWPLWTTCPSGRPRG